MLITSLKWRVGVAVCIFKTESSNENYSVTTAGEVEISNINILTKYNISLESNVRAMQCISLSILTIPIRK